MQKVFAFIKKEVVLIVALVLAIISSFIVPPGKEYLGYIDFKTLCLLFALMAIMAGYKKIGLFRQIGMFLLNRTNSVLGILCVLIFLPFFLSMLITNDVALITFVPFALVVLTMFGKNGLVVPCVVLQTVAANLGSMLLPMGNPQNLYLYSKSGISLGGFVAIMLPYTILSFLLIFACILVVVKKCQKTTRLEIDQNAQPNNAQPETAAQTRQSRCEKNKKLSLVLFSLLFLLAFLAIAKILHQYVLAAIVLAFFIIYDISVLKDVDYSLLLTFIGFFIFIGNMGNIQAFSDFLQKIILNHETLVAVLASQVISNVPAALLLSGFTGDYTALIIGTNLGGLGTLIASMASLISFKQITANAPLQKGKYFAWFTASNVAFLLLLLAEWLLFRLF